jgi:hypothetical protein
MSRPILPTGFLPFSMLLMLQGSHPRKPEDQLDTKQAKKHQRMIRNRASAQLHRERKRRRVADLEVKLKAALGDNERLSARVHVLEGENQQLLRERDIGFGGDPLMLLGDEYDLSYAEPLRLLWTPLQRGDSTDSDILQDHQKGEDEDLPREVAHRRDHFKFNEGADGIHHTR